MKRTSVAPGVLCLLLLGCPPVEPPGMEACPAPTGEVIRHSSAIHADETWAGDGSVHHVDGVTIDSGTLTIAACARVELAAFAGIRAMGTGRLVAAGTAAGPISFTRANPDAAWGVILADGLDARIELHHTTLDGGGNGGASSMLRALGDPARIVRVPSVLVDHVTLRNAARDGVELASSAAFAPGSSDLVIEGSGENAVLITGNELDTLPTMEVSGNSNDAIVVHGDLYLDHDMTLHPYADYVFPGGFHLQADAPNELVTLTLDPGVTVRVGDGQGIYVGSSGGGGGEFPADLQAVGTAERTITFTGMADAPVAGDWIGISFQLSPTSHLTYVTVEYAGAFSGLVSPNCRPTGSRDDAAIIVRSVPQSDMLSNVIVRACAGHGIDAAWKGEENGPNLTSTVVFDSIAGCRQTLNGIVDVSCDAYGCLVD